MNDTCNMLDNLDKLPWQLLKELADEAEDRGQPNLAAGWRWLAKNQKWPASHERGWYAWKVSAGGFKYELPGCVYGRLGSGTPKRIWRRWRTASEALHAAAIAAGRYLYEKK